MGTKAILWDNTAISDPGLLEPFNATDFALWDGAGSDAAIEVGPVVGKMFKVGGTKAVYQIVSAPSGSNLIGRYLYDYDLHKIKADSPAAGGPVSVAAPTPLYITVTSLNLRGAPATTGKIIGKLKFGQHVADAQICADGKWAYSKSLGGYFATDYKGTAYISGKKPTTAKIVPANPKTKEPLESLPDDGGNGAIMAVGGLLVAAAVTKALKWW